MQSFCFNLREQTYNFAPSFESFLVCLKDNMIFKNIARFMMCISPLFFFSQQQEQQKVQELKFVFEEES